jgi:microfibrillar-associated protein 1
MPPKRMTANPIKAPRYRPGKVVEEAPSSESEAESEDEAAPAPIAPPPKATTAKGITSALKQADINAISKREEARKAEEKAAIAKLEEGFETESEEDEEDSEDEDGSEEDSSEEESSEEEAPRRVMMRPTFVRKDKRGQVSSAAAANAKTEEELAAAEEARRIAAANEIVEEQIRKDLAAKEAGKRNWDDDEDSGDDVDDTDDVDPEAEYAAWKLRELKRIKRDREAIELREKELEEVERRKNLTEEERRAEDEEYIAKQREEKEGKGKMAYMQKYFHKGAFYQDDAQAEGLDRRDIMGSRFVDDVQNRDLLPQALQIRDMTKLGKRGATKYKDLKSEDTGKWGEFNDRKGGGRGYGDDETFRPDGPGERGGPETSGSNSVPVGEKRRRIG